MKILCLERDNTTYQSNNDKNGNSYRASFELFPFREGKDYSVFKGMLNGMGPKRGAFCAVKARVTKPGTEFDWNSMALNSQTAQKMADHFNKFIKRRSIFFTEPLIAQMNKVSDFNGIMKIFQPHEKKLKQHEYVVLEDFIEGKFERFSSASGATASSEADMTQAFTHFTWHHTREFVICGLQGVKKDGRFELTTPTIHSLSGRFGPGDCRYPGILEFFYHHQCNNICCPLDTPLRQSNGTTLPTDVNINSAQITSPPMGVNSNPASFSTRPTGVNINHSHTLPSGIVLNPAHFPIQPLGVNTNHAHTFPSGSSSSAHSSTDSLGVNLNHAPNLSPSAPPAYYTY